MIVVGFDPVWSVFSVPLTDKSLLAAVHGDGQLDTGLLAERELSEKERLHVMPMLALPSAPPISAETDWPIAQEACSVFEMPSHFCSSIVAALLILLQAEYETRVCISAGGTTIRK